MPKIGDTLVPIPDHRITASGLVDSGKSDLYAVMLTGDGDYSKLELFDSLDGSGDAKMTIHCPEYGTSFVDLSNIGPKLFLTGLYATITGEDAVGHVWCV